MKELCQLRPHERRPRSELAAVADAGKNYLYDYNNYRSALDSRASDRAGRAPSAGARERAQPVNRGAVVFVLSPAAACRVDARRQGRTRSVRRQPSGFRHDENPGSGDTPSNAAGRRSAPRQASPDRTAGGHPCRITILARLQPIQTRSAVSSAAVSGAA